MKVVNRQTYNIATDLSVQANNNFNVGFNLRFVPDEVIVRSLSYSDVGTNDQEAACQIYCSLIDDQILACFVSGSNYAQNMENYFCIKGRRFQTGSVNFQIQYVPTAAQRNTGTGTLTLSAATNPPTLPVVQGQLAFQLEFIKYQD